MAASIKVSELQELLALTSDDLFLVTDLGSGSSRKVSYATLISGLEAQIGTSQATLQAAIDAVQFDVDQNELASDTAIAHEASNRTAATATLRSLIDALQADVDQNEVDADAAIAAETSARTVAVTDETTAREQAIAALQALVDALQTESASRLTRIESLETSLDNLDIDIAPETLNSIDELAAAMGNDPTFLTTLQNRVSIIENDNATQTELNDYIAHIEARNLEAGLATGVLYADTIYGG
jgi:hypothetical protein